MEKRQISQLLKKGLGYIHIANQIGSTELAVSEFVRTNLPEQARTKGRVPSVIANSSFAKRFAEIGVVKLAKELGVSISAVYRAKNRYDSSP
jgi:predicted transcriptional regulator